MTAEPLPIETLTFEEYLKFEELDERRHEFVGDEVHLMTGESQAHGLVVQELNARLYGPFRARPKHVVNLDGVQLNLADVFAEVRETRVSE